MKKYRFLITIPHDTHYYFYNCNELAKSLKLLGHDVSISKNNLNGISLNKFIIKYKIDIVLQINQGPVAELPAKVVHISWYQDIHDEHIDIQNYLNSKSIIYLLGSPKNFNLGFKPKVLCKNYFFGVNKNIIKKKEIEKDIDINHIAYIPRANSKILENSIVILFSKLFSFFSVSLFIYKFINMLSKIYKKYQSYNFLLNINFSRKKFFIFHIPVKNYIEQKIKHLYKTLRYILESETIHTFHRYINNNYTPLGGNLNVLEIKQKLRKIKNFDYLWDRHKFILTEYPRLLDRLLIGDHLLKLSTKYNVFLAGKNWNSYSKFAKISRPHISSHKQIIDIYRRSKITICNNNHGIGMHSRVLESMAAGSFVLMNESPFSKEPSGIGYSLKKGTHYDVYNKDNLTEKIEYWLKNNKKRTNAIQYAKKFILKNHLWSNRANELITDLKYIKNKK